MTPVHMMSATMTRTHTVSVVLAWAVLLLCLAGTAHTDPLANSDSPAVTATSGWVRATPPGAKNAAAFLTLENLGDTGLDLVGVACAPAVAARCELHQHKHSEGRMRMEKVDTLQLPAHSQVVFAPGGYHIMLLDIAAPLVAGGTVELIFTFAGQTPYHARLPVKSVHEE